VLTSTGKSGQSQPIAARQWHSGFLPSKFQGVHFRSKGDPVLYVGSPPGVTADRQKDIVDTASQLNQLHGGTQDDPEIATRISQYEMAFRMQTSVPELMDLSKEDAKTLELYGTKAATARSRRTACWPAGWPSAASASSSSTTAIGTTTAASRTTSRSWPRRSIRPATR